MSANYCHLKRESDDPRRSNAYAKTLCGREDPGLYLYATLEPGDPLPETEHYPVCPGCIAAHEGRTGEGSITKRVIMENSVG